MSFGLTRHRPLDLWGPRTPNTGHTLSSLKTSPCPAACLCDPSRPGRQVSKLQSPRTMPAPPFNPTHSLWIHPNLPPTCPSPGAFARELPLGFLSAPDLFPQPPQHGSKSELSKPQGSTFLHHSDNGNWVTIPRHTRHRKKEPSPCRQSTRKRDGDGYSKPSGKNRMASALASGESPHSRA